MRSSASPRVGEIRRYPIDTGQKGINREMIPAMCRIVVEEHGDPEVRDLALDIVERSKAKEKDRIGYVTAIYEYVNDRFHWIDDPVLEETLVWPRRFAKNLRKTDARGGKVLADCASVSMMLVSLLGAIGIRAMFVFAGDGERDRGEPVVYHVFVKVDLPEAGNQVYLEPTLHLPAGMARQYKTMYVRDPYKG